MAHAALDIASPFELALGDIDHGGDMSTHLRGKRLAASPARAVVLELLHHARKAPSLPVAKSMNLAALVELRKDARVSWMALFLKAYSLTALEHPELRRA